VSRDQPVKRQRPRRRATSQTRAGPKLTIRLDRIRVVSWAKRGWKLPAIRGFQVVKDHRVRPRDGPITYTRVRELKSLLSGAKVFWQYRPRPGWLKEWRITWVADDRNGIAPLDILRILKRCRYFRFALLELAFDFSPRSSVNRRFVRQHGKFGKSRRCFDRGGEEQLRFGSRKSGKLIRCYMKEEVQAFRVELEFHSRLFAKRNHPKAEKNYKFIDVPNRILPVDIDKHFRFVRIRWGALESHLLRRFGTRGPTILDIARAKAEKSLGSLTAFLRSEGVNNVHRFLAPMSINRSVDQALTTWLLDFRDAWQRLL
jgi:hypothetical protein